VPADRRPSDVRDGGHDERRRRADRIHRRVDLRAEPAAERGVISSAPRPGVPPGRPPAPRARAPPRRADTYGLRT
jgi:hypothetical protein